MTKEKHATGLRHINSFNEIDRNSAAYTGR